MTSFRAWRKAWQAGGALAVLSLAALGPASAADGPVASEFAWRATLELPAGANAARVTLPAAALARLRSADARDVRVFNAGGEAVAFTLARPAALPASAAPRTAAYPAFELFPGSGAAGTAPQAGAVQVSIEEPTGTRKVWVQLGGAPRQVAGAPASATPVQAVIFDTRGEKQLLSAIEVQAELPANVPVLVSAEISTDLDRWQALPLRGRLYRFEGAGAPVNAVLEFEQPVQLERRYLRLGWYGQEGVRLRAVAGLVAQAAVQAPRERLALGAPVAGEQGVLDWTLDFATPVAALSLQSTRANTLVPVRIQGRMEAGQPWRELGQTVVYRLGNGDAASTNPPALLGAVAVRQLRVVPGSGLALDPGALQAHAEFDPVQVVFLATGAPPFTLAAGRADTPAVALGNAMLAGVLPAGRLDNAAPARITAVTEAERGTGGGWWERWTRLAGGRSVLLWGVLALGVLLLAGVAFALLRQLSAPAGAAKGN